MRVMSSDRGYQVHVTRLDQIARDLRFVAEILLTVMQTPGMEFTVAAQERMLEVCKRWPQVDPRRPLRGDP